MRTWALVGRVCIGIVTWGGFLYVMNADSKISARKPDISITCKSEGDTGDCKIENKGEISGDVDVNVILACHDGEHQAHISARVEAHDHTTKIIEGFEPSVDGYTKCAGIDYRDILVRPTGQ